MSFQNDYKDENDSFGSICLYVDMLEILRKTVLRKDLKRFKSERVSKETYFEKRGFNSKPLASNSLPLVFGSLKGF